MWWCSGKKDSEKLIELCQYKDRIINHVGDTTFGDWSAIVQHAAIVIGNDSATLHIAAATKRKCICITGIYDKYQFFPYKVDELSEGEILPVTVIKEKSCAYCRTKGYFAGYGNKQCKSMIKKGKCALCIDEISVDDVKDVIITCLGEE